jgi:hypothetical protein
MCVIVAKKIRLHGTDVENWFLFKCRDRIYDPEYSFRFLKGRGIESVFLVDEISSWTEGTNSVGISLVNTALQNHQDQSVGEAGGPVYPNRDGIIVRQCLKMKDIKEVVETIKRELLLGNTFVTDGDRLFVIEIAIKAEAVERATNAIDDIKSIKFASEIQHKIMQGIHTEDYLVKAVEIRDPKIDLVVRTNHGVLISQAGYQKSDKDLTGYESSMARYKHTYDAIKDLDKDTHPFQILTIIKNLGQDDVDENPKNRPVRNKGWSKYYTSCVVMLTPTGTLFVVPIDCKFKTTDHKHLNQKHKVGVVILPKDMPLFENIGRKTLGDFIKISEYEKYL